MHANHMSMQESQLSAVDSSLTQTTSLKTTCFQLSVHAHTNQNKETCRGLCVEASCRRPPDKRGSHTGQVCLPQRGMLKQQNSVVSTLRAMPST